MKKIEVLALSIILAFCGTNVQAKNQDKDLMKGDYLYRHYAFHEAIPYLEKATETTADVEIYRKLGDCYLMTKDPGHAVIWYGKAVRMKDCPADVKLRYAQALMNLQRYNDAVYYLKEYQNVHPADTRIANMLTSCEKAEAMMKEMPTGTVSMAAFNTDGSEFGPSLKGNMLIFTSDSTLSQQTKTDKWTGNPYYNIFAVECAGNGRCSSELQKISGKINTKYHDGPAVFNSWGTDMYFTRTNYTREFITNGSVPDAEGVVRLQIMKASGYDSASMSFKKISPFPFNSKDYSTAHPAMSADGTMMVFTSDMPGGQGGNDLYMTMTDDEGNWSEPVSIGKNVNTEGDEMFPFIADDYTLYFASNGHVGFGGLDIYKSNWDAQSRMFSAPENIGAPVNSSYDDMSITLAKGSSVGYFASNRPATKMGDNIYFVNLQNIFLALNLKDAATGEPIPAGTITLGGLNDNRSFTSASNGGIVTRILPESQYTVQISKPGYKAQTISVNSYNRMNNDTISQDIMLESDFAIYYNAVVIDENTYEQIADPTIVFAKLGGKSADTTYLSGAETFTRSLDPNAEYAVYAVKDKYYSNERMVSTAGITKNMGTTRIKDTLFMKELKIGEVYKIDNIYYDYNKANIREDAKPSLNRLIQLLEQYPDMSIQVNSHTDCRGANAYNMNLSKARANSVIKYLQERGINKKRLEFKGFGETKPVEDCPVCDECSEEQHQRNRRTEFQIVSM